MVDPKPGRGVIPSRAVRRLAEPVLVHCPATGDAADSMTVIPLMEGARVAGLEVRCRCGSSVIVECVYEEAHGQ
jgi:hypothetical protein